MNGSRAQKVKLAGLVAVTVLVGWQIAARHARRPVSLEGPSAITIDYPDEGAVFPLVMEGLHTCANCLSFFADGKPLGLDMDGPQNDKGLYAIVKVAPEMTIRNESPYTQMFLTHIGEMGNDSPAILIENATAASFVPPKTPMPSVCPSDALFANLLRQ